MPGHGGGGGHMGGGGGGMGKMASGGSGSRFASVGGGRMASVSGSTLGMHHGGHHHGGRPGPISRGFSGGGGGWGWGWWWPWGWGWPWDPYLLLQYVNVAYDPWLSRLGMTCSEFSVLYQTNRAEALLLIASAYDDAARIVADAGRPLPARNVAAIADALYRYCRGANVVVAAGALSPGTKTGLVVAGAAAAVAAGLILLRKK